MLFPKSIPKERTWSKEKKETKWNKGEQEKREIKGFSTLIENKQRQKKVNEKN